MSDRLKGVKYAKNILETIGKTPLVKLNNVVGNAKPTILAKVEFFNPGGSVKDRPALKMILDEMEKGNLKPGGTVVESTSGNTGCGLALAASVLGLKAIFTMPDKMSQEKIRLLKAYGAEVITCPTNVHGDDPESYYSVAKRLVETIPNAMTTNQYYNPVNPLAHYETTGPEIWEDTAGKVTHFVVGLGTGGTVSGTSKYLKEQNPNVKTIGVDTDGSILKHYFYNDGEMIEARPYLVEGIGEDIIPGNVQFEYIDEIVTADDKPSFAMARRLAREEGLMVGGSCGSAVHGALLACEQFGLTEDDLVVVLLPDTGERYLSKFHSDEWMRDNRMLDVNEMTIGDLVRAKESTLPPVVAVDADESVYSALGRMKMHNLSQIPVRNNGSWVGRVDEAGLMDRVLAGDVSPESRIEGVMGEPMPVIDAKEPYESVLKSLGSRDSAVLVESDGAVMGILTKYDILDYVLSQEGM